MTSLHPAPAVGRRAPVLRRLPRVLASVVASSALLVGIPWLLASTIGNPLDRLPDLMAGDVTSQVILAAIATVVWVAWAQFAIAFGVELWSAIRRTPMPARIPGLLAAQQGLARALISGALLMAPVTTTVIAPAAQAIALSPPVMSSPVAVAAQMVTPMVTDASAAAAKVPTRMVTVATDGGRSWWDLATTHLGDGTAWHQLWELNRGRTQHDGTVLLSDATPLRPGWTVLVPDPASAAGSTVDVVVEPGDTLARIAADHGQEWTELWEENSGRAQPGDARFSDPDYIEPGWTITIPAPTAAADANGDGPTVTVQAGETVTAIAGRHGVDVADLIDANQGLAQPGGERFTDPDHIEPGWVLLLPTPSGTELTPGRIPPGPAGDPSTADTGRLGQPQPAPPPAGDDPASASPAPASAAPEAGTPVAGSTDAATSAEAPAPPMTTVPAGPGSATSAADVSGPPADDEVAGAPAESASAAPIEVFAGAGGAILGALLLTALLRARWRQRDHRRPGEQIVGAPPDLVDLERVLRSIGGAAAADAQWLDEALRGLGQTVARIGGTFPDVTAACVTDHELRLLLATPSDEPVGDWTVRGDGSWVLTRNAATGYDPVLRDRHLPPYPALATVGSTADGEHWLLDLERIGAVTVTGDAGRAAGLARFVAAELAHNSWSGLSQVTLIGFGREMAEMHPDRLTYVADAAAALDPVTAQLRAVSTASTSSASVLAGRCQGETAEAWAPHVLLVAPDDLPDRRGIDDLLAAVAACPGRCTVALVVTTGGAGAAPAGGWVLEVDQDGTLAIPHLDLRLRAQQLPEADAGQVARLLALAADPDQCRRPTPAPSAGAEHQSAGDERWARAGTALPLPASVYLDRAATTDEDLAVLAPPIPTEVRREVEAADPDLDVDLADWSDRDSRRPRIGVLGPVEVLAAGGGTTRRLAALKAEAAVHLAVHSAGVTPERLGTDLWPTDPDSATSTKLRQLVYELRRAFGVNPATGLEYLPRNTGAGALYRLEDVLIDAELFRRLRVRASARTDQDLRVQDWWTALRLVRGVPLDQRRAGGYAWLAGRPIHEEYRGSIVDVAHLLATHHLSVGEPERAEQAAAIALSASEEPDDTALLDLMWACDAQDRRAEGDAYADRIRAKHGDVLEDCPPRTYELLLRRQRRAA